MIFASGLAVGCADGLGPRSFAGSYGLTAVFEPGRPLPVTVYVGSNRTTVFIRVEAIADTLELKGDGSYVERSIYRITENETTNPIVTIDTSMGYGTFSVNDEGTLTFLANTEPANCAFLCGLQMKTATTVLARSDTLAFQNVVWASQTWNPRYVRRP